MIESITYFVIVSNFDSSLIIAEYFSIGNWYIKFFEGIQELDPMFVVNASAIYLPLHIEVATDFSFLEC
jgi:hypothetical protein